jgi:hypothetical protein
MVDLRTVGLTSNSGIVGPSVVGWTYAGIVAIYGAESVRRFSPAVSRTITFEVGGILFIIITLVTLLNSVHRLWTTQLCCAMDGQGGNVGPDLWRLWPGGNHGQTFLSLTITLTTHWLVELSSGSRHHAKIIATPIANPALGVAFAIGLGHVVLLGTWADRLPRSLSAG